MTQRAEVFRCRICDVVWNQYIQNSKYKEEDICAHCSTEIDEVLRDFELADLVQHLAETEEGTTDYVSSVQSDVPQCSDEQGVDLRKG